MVPVDGVCSSAQCGCDSVGGCCPLAHCIGQLAPRRDWMSGLWRNSLQLAWWYVLQGAACLVLCKSAGLAGSCWSIKACMLVLLAWSSLLSILQPPRTGCCCVFFSVCAADTTRGALCINCMRSAAIPCLSCAGVAWCLAPLVTCLLCAPLVLLPSKSKADTLFVFVAQAISHYCCSTLLVQGCFGAGPGLQGSSCRRVAGDHAVSGHAAKMAAE